MTARTHLLVIDPTAFPGGSKTATENILRLLDPERVRITVLSADHDSWQLNTLKRMRLRQPAMLSSRIRGLGYFLRHALIAIQVLWTRLRQGRIHTALGASGPGVDLALYLARPLLGYRLLQLIHGPVAHSRTLGRCLRGADAVHYLESSCNSMAEAMRCVSKSSVEPAFKRFQIMRNGLPEQQWPSRCQTDRPVLFWAASLLKWKGLELLVDALERIDNCQRPETHICYIRPQDTQLDISPAPQTLHKVHWYEQPEDLDRLRAAASIFVSTSKREPFGLSILEAMAAGHCVLLPADGAYWDHVLEDGVHCVKYRPGDAQDLADKLITLS